MRAVSRRTIRPVTSRMATRAKKGRGAAYRNEVDANEGLGTGAPSANPASEDSTPTGPGVVESTAGRVGVETPPTVTTQSYGPASAKHACAIVRQFAVAPE